MSINRETTFKEELLTGEGLICELILKNNSFSPARRLESLNKIKNIVRSVRVRSLNLGGTITKRWKEFTKNLLRKAELAEIKDIKEKFITDVMAFDYPKDMLEDFINYWTEGKKKMRYQKQTTFENGRAPFSTPINIHWFTHFCGY